MIAIGSDHRGYKLKEEIKKYLSDKQIEVKDFGTYSEERMDYPVVEKNVASCVQKDKDTKGILICGTGFGMTIVANKFKGIRCVPCYNETTTKYAKAHNDANILALGAEELKVADAINIIRIWLGTEFEGERHLRRLEMIEEIEKENMK